jgi:hypothetical protein
LFIGTNEHEKHDSWCLQACLLQYLVFTDKNNSITLIFLFFIAYMLIYLKIRDSKQNQINGGAQFVSLNPFSVW